MATQAYRDAIASIESRGSGDYAAVGPRHPKMGRALGRYQIMEANIGPWSQEALGRTVTPAEFMSDPAIQDAVFDHRFGQYVGQFGPEGAAQAWFAGPGGVGKTNRKDVLGTDVGTYGQRFTKALGIGSHVAAQPSASPQASGTPAPPLDPPINVASLPARPIQSQPEPPSGLLSALGVDAAKANPIFAAMGQMMPEQQQPPMMQPMQAPKTMPALTDYLSEFLKSRIV
ncbi:hypothetical protein [Falsochrobactrum shanghaiense]|uniref:hypothetical protein n=1 Tax=Falsochrobactrum shanghaiense TaxID=2201899 RepID=UPI001FE05547|nr:hypothetical protein [Falsochrobactrum shanghaiense]